MFAPMHLILLPAGVTNSQVTLALNVPFSPGPVVFPFVGPFVDAHAVFEAEVPRFGSRRFHAAADFGQFGRRRNRTDAAYRKRYDA
jgi:hypothetical protein